MNKTALKNFAINARLELLARVRDRAALYGITEEKVKAHELARSEQFQKLDGDMLTQREIAQRNALISRVSARGFTQAMEEAAYTWFNRFIALRYMQAHNLLPVDVPVLPMAAGELPQIVRQAQNVTLEGVDIALVADMLDNNRTEELYKYLLIALCNALSEPLPQMFEAIEDYTELLFPDGILKAESVLGMLAGVEPDNWQDIQVIGWLYQYYISQRHDEVVNINGGAIPKDDIPAATCLYTTDWVVKYMVENSLGRLWLEGHPDKNLRMKWRYYMDEAEQTPEVAAQLAEQRKGYADRQPETITVLDPCMGSGHILVYAFDVLMDIYRSRGYTDRDAVQSIVTNNLYGLDIDDRAAQLAYFAVMMKACEYDRRFLCRGVQPQVCAIQESPAIDGHALDSFGPDAALAKKLYATFINAKEYGSILHVDLTGDELRRLSHSVIAMSAATTGESIANIGDSKHAAEIIAPLVKQAVILAQKYDAVITNPPYMNKFDKDLKKYIQDNYPDCKSDLFSVFIYRNFDFCKPGGYSGFMSPFVWMFIKSYEKLREYIIRNKSITTLIQMEYSAFEEATVPICSFVLGNYQANYAGNYLRLSDFKGGMDVQDAKVLEAQDDPKCKYRYTAQQENFTKIPGMPVAYWAHRSIYDIYEKCEMVGDVSFVGIGMRTGDNGKFLRLWHEIARSKAMFCAKDRCDAFSSNGKWFPYNKGGDNRKWYGNNEYVVNWEHDGREIKADTRKKYPQLGDNLSWKISNEEYYFREILTWSFVSSAGFGGVRYKPHGQISDVAGSMIVAKDTSLYYLAGFLSSVVTKNIISMLNPTINVQIKDIASLPFLKSDSEEEICSIVEMCISVSKCDWDSFEASWDFQFHPMI